MHIELVPGRECGPCKACCTQPIIPALKKLPGIVCPHWAQDIGCTIYETRAPACRGHMCGWRLLGELPHSWRPDLSQLYIRLIDGPPGDFRDQVPEAAQHVVFAIMGEIEGPQLRELAAFCATLIRQDIPVFLTAPAPPEHVRRNMPLNALLKRFVDAGEAVFAEAFAMAFAAAANMPLVRACFDESDRLTLAAAAATA